MKIYHVVPDVNQYQSFLVEDDRVWETEELTFDCMSKASSWNAPDVFILKPKLRRGNFFNLCAGTLVLDMHATETLEDLLEMSGELLPLDHQGEKFTVLNVTECVNVLDTKATKWIYGKTTG